MKRTDYGPRAAGDQSAPAAQGRIGAEILLDGGQDLHRLGHPPAAELAARSPLGPDLENAAGFEGGDIGLGRGMGPHQGVHRGRDQHRLVGRQQGRGGKIVGQPMGQLGQEVGAGGGHHDQIGFPRQADMAHLALVGEGEELLIDLALAEGRHRQRGHELRPALGQDGAHRNAPLAQPSDQLQALIGGDAAGDHEQ
jgi:hypothetical protein